MWKNPLDFTFKPMVNEKSDINTDSWTSVSEYLRTHPHTQTLSLPFLNVHKFLKSVNDRLVES